MSTVCVRGQDVRVGDDLWFLGKPYRVTRIVPYTHPVVTGGEWWRIAKSDGPERGGQYAWGMTLETQRGYADGYTIGMREFTCEHCKQAIGRCRDLDPDGTLHEDWTVTTGWLHLDGNPMCPDGEHRADRAR